MGRAVLLETRLESLSLRSAHHLVEAEHLGPSHLSTSTLVLSRGQIPAAFLKGCGLQDWEIAAAKLYDPNLSTAEITDLQYEVFRLRTTRPLMVNNLFVSYSHVDADFAEALRQRLDERGVRCWQDIHDMTAGRMETQIDRAMRLHPVVLLILSENSVNSDWVESEVRKARELEKELRAKGMPKDVLLPVALDDAWKTCDWPGWLRQQMEDYYVVPFEGWEVPAVMDRQFEKVVAGLPLYGPK